MSRALQQSSYLSPFWLPRELLCILEELWEFAREDPRLPEALPNDVILSPGTLPFDNPICMTNRLLRVGRLSAGVW